MISIRQLDALYETYNRACYMDPDPLVFLHRYPRVEDREIVGLIASCLAFGRVQQICASVEKVLAPMGSSPRAFLESSTPEELAIAYSSFRHRYASGQDLIDLLAGIKRNLDRFGSLNQCFTDGLGPKDQNVINALGRFVESMGCTGNYLLPSPGKGSACKRLHLYLRWMVRSDDVDPGGWTGVSPSLLVIPLDTHMARLSRTLGFSRRRSADAVMALAVTRWFSRRVPHDPVKYDFTLTRFGIHPDLRHTLPR